MFSSVTRTLNRYSGELGVAICAVSSSVVLGYIMDDCHKMEMVALRKEITNLQINYENKITHLSSKINTLESQMK